MPHVNMKEAKQRRSTQHAKLAATCVGRGPAAAPEPGDPGWNADSVPKDWLAS